MEKAKTRTSPFRYGIGMFGTSLPINMFRAFAAAFYVIERNLSMEKLSLIIFIYTFLDAIDNPVYGLLSDNTRSRFGRRKPWLIISTPLFVIFFILFYSPPMLGETGIFVWALVFYSITGTLDSMINANYGALFPELFPEDKLRAKTNAIRQIFQLVAMVIGIALTPMITAKIGYTYTAIIYGVLALAVVLFMALGIREPKAIERKEKVDIKAALISMAKSRNFWIVGVSNAFYSAAMALVLAGVPFFITYALNLSGDKGTYVLGTVILVAIFGVIFWSALVKKFGTMPVWRTTFIVLALAFVPLYFASSLTTAIICSVLVGIGFSGVISTMDIVGAKVLDEDYNKYGIRREGIYSSAMGFMNRLSGLFVSLGTYLASRIYGFIDGDQPGDRPGQAAKFIITIFPFIMMILGIVSSRFVKFKTEGRTGPQTPSDNGLAEENKDIQDSVFEDGITASESIKTTESEA